MGSSTNNPNPAEAHGPAREAVLQPIDIRGRTAKNRFVALPLGISGLIDGDDSPTERMIAMYRRRAAGGSALVTVEATYVEPHPVARRGLLGFSDGRQFPQYALLADAIHDEGALASIQITNRWHTDFTYELGDLTADEIESLIDHFARGAERAAAAGFDIVEIHIAHGWPLARFASPLFNRRHDKYGDHSYVPSQVVERSRAAVGNDAIIAARLSILENPMDGKQGISIEKSIEQLCPALEVAGVDLLSLTFGQGPIAPDLKDYNATELIYLEPGDKFEYFRQVRETVGVPVIGRSRINDPAMAEAAVRDGHVDLIGLGRQILADPDFPAKVEDGRRDEINRCTACDYCAGRVGVQGKTLRCAINESVGRELVVSSRPSIRRPKKVLVVGGGPAGMEAACGLDDLGCEVMLVEQGDELGGTLRLAAELPKLRLLDLGYLVDQLTTRVAKSAISVQLGQPFHSELLDTFEPAAVVWATGSVPPPTAWGAAGATTVLTTMDLLRGANAGARVVVDGRGEGAEIAVSLARQGRAVTLVEATHRLVPTTYDYGVRRIEALNDYLVEEAVDVRWRSQVTSVENGAVVVTAHNGRTSTIAADTLVIAGRVSHVPVDQPLDVARLVARVGDCVAPRGIGEALDEARAAVRSIAG